MIGNTYQLASFTRINGSGTSNYVSATLLTKDSYQDTIGFHFVIHSMTATCPTNPSAQIWIEKSADENAGFAIPRGMNSYSVVNTNTTHLWDMGIFSISSCYMPYTRICVGLTSATPSTYFSCWAFYQEEY